MKKNKKGFTLMEMLIVVAIIAVLVAIAIPVLSNNLHKAKVAADWANMRAYYAYLQSDYLTTGEINKNYLRPLGLTRWTEFEMNGTTIKLQTGIFVVDETAYGYQISYYCNDAAAGKDGHYPDCVLILGGNKNG